jgi:hypothetical protein
MGFVPDRDVAEKVVTKVLGRVKNIDFVDFYKLFCRSIFRVALVEMLNAVETMTKSNKDLPLLVKLGAYRRNLLLQGLSDDSPDK